MSIGVRILLFDWEGHIFAEKILAQKSVENCQKIQEIYKKK